MIGVGQRAPDFALPLGSGGTSRFYGHVGGSPVLLVFAGDDAQKGVALAGRLRDTIGPSATLHVVAREATDHDEDVYVDAEATVHRAFGVDTGEPVVLVLDPNVRVAATASGSSESGLDNVLDTFRRLVVERTGSRVRRHAPVLLVPGALEPALCDRVISAWEAADPIETGVETTADGRRLDALDRLRKRRRDHIVTDSDLLRELTTHIGSRVLPEVTKAFAYTANRFEGFKIGSYTEQDEGFFEAHRDNLSPATAHRRFALSINLNDDYDGGELCFPEYGPDLYRPDRGEALVFSGSHLHEVRPVTRGRRFVLLSFLFGSDARQARPAR